MTREYREWITCPHCQQRISTEHPFSKWVRRHEQLKSELGMYVCDLDYVFHRFAWRHKDMHGQGILDRRVQYMMCVELKTFGKELSGEQRDTIYQLDQVIRSKQRSKNRGENGRFQGGHAELTVYSPFQNNRTYLLHYGVHVLRMSGDSPGNSDWMTWDNRPIDDRQLAGLLSFTLSPDNPDKPIEHRRRKRGNKTPPLRFKD